MKIHNKTQLSNLYKKRQKVTVEKYVSRKTFQIQSHLGREVFFCLQLQTVFFLFLLSVIVIGVICKFHRRIHFDFSVYPFFSRFRSFCSAVRVRPGMAWQRCWLLFFWCSLQLLQLSWNPEVLYVVFLFPSTWDFSRTVHNPLLSASRATIPPFM